MGTFSKSTTIVQSGPLSPGAQKPRLLEQVRNRIRTKHYSLSTEKTYLQWVKQFILFHNKRHPREMGSNEIG